MKNFKIVSSRISGEITVDEKDIIQIVPSYWNKYKTKRLQDLLQDLDRPEIHYRLVGGIYEGRSNSKSNPKGFVRPQERDRRGQDQPSKAEGEGGRTPEPIEERSRIIIRRGSIQKGLDFGS
jgi:hypothetical protein